MQGLVKKTISDYSVNTVSLNTLLFIAAGHIILHKYFLLHEKKDLEKGKGGEAIVTALCNIAKDMELQKTKEEKTWVSAYIFSPRGCVRGLFSKIITEVHIASYILYT